MGGINKALIEIGGITVIKRTLAIIEPLFGEIIAAGWPSGDPLPASVIAVQDNYPGIGPLAGIEAALRASRTQALFVFGGDMPWLSADIIKKQADYYLKNPSDILVARSEGLPEPLHSIYGKAIHQALVRYIEEGGSPAIIDFYKFTDTRFFELPQTEETRRALTNINRPADLKS